MIGLIHSTDKCNLHCTYCRSRKGTRIMDKPTLYNAIGFTIQAFDDSKGSQGSNMIEWHAAEPMMLPVSWYESAETILETMGFKWGRAMASNCTLLDNAWAEFLKTYKYSISLSLDGNKHLHDYNRGNGSFEKVISAMIRLKQHHIPFGTICVLSEHSCDHIEELYTFFKRAGISVKLNVQIPNTFNEKSADAMIKLYDLWRNDGCAIKIDPFIDMTNWIIGISKRCKCFIPCGEQIFSIDTNGDVYPCGTFVSVASTGEYIYGNVNTDRWDDIWFGEKRARFLEFKNTRPDECLECEYRGYCGGGCSRDSVQCGNTEIRMGSTCGIYKPLMDHIAEKVGWLGGT